MRNGRTLRERRTPAAGSSIQRAHYAIGTTHASSGMNIRSLLIVGALIALTASAAWIAQGWRFEARIARIQSEHAHSLAQAEQAARAIEQRYVKELDHARTTAQSQYDQLRIAADAAGADADRLRAELARLRRQAASHSATADRSPGQPDQPAVDLLAGMLERMEEHGRAMAQYADQLRIAGLTCEAAFEGVRQ